MGGVSFETVWAATQPVLRVCIMAGVGVWLARKGVLDKAAQQKLATVVFVVFAPALTFVKLSESVTLDALRHWWPLWVSIGACIGTGGALGLLVATWLRVPKRLSKLIVAATAFGNVGNLPLVLVASVCQDSGSVIARATGPECESLGMSYVTFGMALATLLVFGISLPLLRSAGPLPPIVLGPQDFADGRENGGSHPAGGWAAATAPPSPPAAKEGPCTVAPTATGDAAVALGPKAHGKQRRGGGRGAPPGAARGPLRSRDSAMDIDLHGGAGYRSEGGGGRGGRDGRLQSGLPAPAEVELQCRANGAAPSVPGAGRAEDDVNHDDDEDDGMLAISSRGGSGMRDEPRCDDHRQQQQQQRQEQEQQQSGFEGDGCAIIQIEWEEGKEEAGGAGARAGTSSGGGEPPDGATAPKATATGITVFSGGGGASGGGGRRGPTDGGGDASTSDDDDDVDDGCGERERLLLLPGSRKPSGGGGSWPSVLGGSGCAGGGGDDGGGRGGGATLRWIRRAGGTLIGATLRIPWRDVLTPSVLAALIAMVVGCVPSLKSLLVGGEAPLLLVQGTMDTFADACIPCMMLTLGATFSAGPRGSGLAWRTVVAVCCVRLLLLPAMGTCLVLLLDRAGVLPPDDPLFRFVMLLQTTVPSATMLQTMATMVGSGETEMSALLFFQYLASMASTPAWLMVYFRLLGP